MKAKMNLLIGIYINEEYPIQVKRNRDKLRPILKFAKKTPRLQGQMQTARGQVDNQQH